jgi:hypothetical protein
MFLLYGTIKSFFYILIKMYLALELSLLSIINMVLATSLYRKADRNGAEHSDNGANRYCAYFYYVVLYYL